MSASPTLYPKSFLTSFGITSTAMLFSSARLSRSAICSSSSRAMVWSLGWFPTIRDRLKSITNTSSAPESFRFRRKIFPKPMRGHKAWSTKSPCTTLRACSSLMMHRISEANTSVSLSTVRGVHSGMYSRIRPRRCFAPCDGKPWRLGLIQPPPDSTCSVESGNCSWPKQKGHEDGSAS